MRALPLVPFVALAALPVPAIARPTAIDGARASVVSLVDGAAPVAGRFCKTADPGKRRRDAKGRMLRCQMKSGHYRWVVVAG